MGSRLYIHSRTRQTRRVVVWQLPLLEHMCSRYALAAGWTAHLAHACTCACIALQRHTTPCHAVPYHTIPYHTIPSHTIPYHTIPYHTIPYHTIPYHTIPYHTIPRVCYRRRNQFCSSFIMSSFDTLPCRIIKTNQTYHHTNTKLAQADLLWRPAKSIERLQGFLPTVSRRQQSVFFIFWFLFVQFVDVVCACRVCVCVCVCACVCGRERERERVCVCEVVINDATP